MNERTPDELLSAYFDGEATAAERETVERMLEQSPDLRHELQEIGALSSLLRGLPREFVPQEFSAALRRNMEMAALLGSPLELVNEQGTVSCPEESDSAIVGQFSSTISPSQETPKHPGSACRPLSHDPKSNIPSFLRPAGRTEKGRWFMAAALSGLGLATMALVAVSFLFGPRRHAGNDEVPVGKRDILARRVPERTKNHDLTSHAEKAAMARESQLRTSPSSGELAGGNVVARSDLAANVKEGGNSATDEMVASASKPHDLQSRGSGTIANSGKSGQGSNSPGGAASSPPGVASLAGRNGPAMPSADLREESFHSQPALSRDQLARVQIGDVVPYFKVEEGKVAVIEVTVIDIHRALDDVQILLAENAVPVVPGLNEEPNSFREKSVASGSGDKAGESKRMLNSLPGEKNSNAPRIVKSPDVGASSQRYAVYVESNEKQLAAALSQIEEQGLVVNWKLQPPANLSRVKVSAEEFQAANVPIPRAPQVETLATAAQRGRGQANAGRNSQFSGTFGSPGGRNPAAGGVPGFASSQRERQTARSFKANSPMKGNGGAKMKTEYGRLNGARPRFPAPAGAKKSGDRDAVANKSKPNVQTNRPAKGYDRLPLSPRMSKLPAIAGADRKSDAAARKDWELVERKNSGTTKASSPTVNVFQMRVNVDPEGLRDDARAITEQVGDEVSPSVEQDSAPGREKKPLSVRGAESRNQTAAGKGAGEMEIVDESIEAGRPSREGKLMPSRTAVASIPTPAETSPKSLGENRAFRRLNDKSTLMRAHEKDPTEARDSTSETKPTAPIRVIFVFQGKPHTEGSQAIPGSPSLPVTPPARPR